MKKISDTLDIGGNTLSSNEFIMHILAGLDDFYKSLVTNVLTILDKEKITVEDLFSMLLGHEIRLQKSKRKTQFDVMHDMSANLAQKGQHYNKPNNNILDHGRSRNSFGGDKIVICQICFIPRHSAYKCINMFNHAFIPR